MTVSQAQLRDVPTMEPLSPRVPAAHGLTAAYPCDITFSLTRSIFRYQVAGFARRNRHIARNCTLTDLLCIDDRGVQLILICFVGGTSHAITVPGSASPRVRRPGVSSESAAPSKAVRVEAPQRNVCPPGRPSLGRGRVGRPP